MKQFIQKWLGVPFKEHGRDTNGVDCFGLVLDYLKHKIPDYEYSGKWFLHENLIYENLHKYVYEVEKPRQGDFVIFSTFKNVMNHMGIMIDEKRCIHAIKGAGVVISYVSDLKHWKPKFYRLKNDYYQNNT